MGSKCHFGEGSTVKVKIWPSGCTLRSWQFCVESAQMRSEVAKARANERGLILLAASPHATAPLLTQLPLKQASRTHVHFSLIARGLKLRHEYAPHSEMLLKNSEQLR